MTRETDEKEMICTWISSLARNLRATSRLCDRGEEIHSSTYADVYDVILVQVLDARERLFEESPDLLVCQHLQ